MFAFCPVLEYDLRLEETCVRSFDGGQIKSFLTFGSAKPNNSFLGAAGDTAGYFVEGELIFLDVFIWEGRRRGNVAGEYDWGVIYCECISGGR